MKKALSLIFWAILMGAASSCSAISPLGGQSARQTFANGKVAELAEAASAGDARRVGQLAAEGANVNAIGNNGATPLMWALYARNHAGVEALLRAGANPNERNEKLGHSPMYFVSMGDAPELLRLLLKYGGDPNEPRLGRIEERPLSQAAAKGRIANMELLIQAGAEVNAHDNFEESAATGALDLANFESIAFLLNHGYTYNLPYLARGVKLIQVPGNSDASRWKEKVILMLKERGVYPK